MSDKVIPFNRTEEREAEAERRMRAEIRDRFQEDDLELEEIVLEDSSQDAVDELLLQAEAAVIRSQVKRAIVRLLGNLDVILDSRDHHQARIMIERLHLIVGERRVKASDPGPIERRRGIAATENRLEALAGRIRALIRARDRRPTPLDDDLVLDFLSDQLPNIALEELRQALVVAGLGERFPRTTRS